MEEEKNGILGSKMIEIVRVLNPLDRSTRETIFVEFIPTYSLLDYRNEHLPKDIDFVASINGRVIPKENWSETIPKEDHQLVFIPVMEDAKTITSLATMAAVVVAAFAGQWAAIPYIVMIGSAATMAASLLFPTKIKKPQEADQTQVYDWQPHTVQQPGIPIPRWYGRNKLYGNIINAYRTQYYSSAGDNRVITMLICLGIGPFEAVPGSGIKFNDQSWLVSGSVAISGVSVTGTLGLMRQSVLPGFENDINEYEWIREVKNSTGYEYFTTSTNPFDALRVLIQFPIGIWGANDDGYMNGGITLHIQCAPADNSQPWYDVVNQHIIACRVTNMMYTFNIPMYYGQRQYNIRVGKLSADQINGVPDNNWSWGDALATVAVQEIFYHSLTYPRHVLVAATIVGSNAISGSVKFSAVCQCLKVRTTTDGITWTVQWSDNPAWVAYDILTQPVYDNSNNVLRYDGVESSRLETYIQDWINCAAYCDELVSDGKGGTEKRITFNGGFETETTPYDAAQHVLGLARSFLLITGTSFRVVTDKPRNRTQVFNKADMRPDSYQCTWLSLNDRVSKLEASNFLDAENDYKADTLAVYNKNIKNKATVQSIDVTGITHRGQAWRLLTYYLNYNQYILRTHSFKVDTEAMVSDIGDRIDIQDETVSYGASGRVVSATSDTITLDTPVTIVGGFVYMITIRHKDDTLEDQVVTTSVEGEHTTLSIEPETWDSTPEALVDTWTFGEQRSYLKSVVITSKEYDNETGETSIVAIDYNESIYNGDLETPLLISPVIIAENLLPPVTNIVLKELYAKQANLTYLDYIDVYWDIPNSSYYAGVEVWYKRGDDGIWVFAGVSNSPSTSFPIVVTDTGSYTVALSTFNVLGQKMSIEDSPQETIEVVGYLLIAPITPSDVSKFYGAAMSGGITLTWAANPEVNIDYYKIRFNRGDNTSIRSNKWENSVDMSTVYGTTVSFPVSLNGTYWIKAINDYGNESVNAVAYVCDLPEMEDWYTFVTTTESPLFLGTLEGVNTDGNFLYQDLTGGASTWDDVVDVDLIPDIDNVGMYMPTPEGDGYYTTYPVFLTSVQNVRISINCYWFGDTGPGGVGYQAWDDIMDFDSWNDLSPIVLGPGVSFQVRTEQGDSNWGAWQDIGVVGDFIGRGFQLKVRLYTTIPDRTAYIEDLSWSIIIPNRKESGDDIAINDEDGVIITFAKPYLVENPKIFISEQTAELGDKVVVSNRSRLGFTLKILDINGLGTNDRSVDWIALGY